MLIGFWEWWYGNLCIDYFFVVISYGGSLIYYFLKNILVLSFKFEIGCIGRKKVKNI